MRFINPTLQYIHRYIWFTKSSEIGAYHLLNQSLPFSVVIPFKEVFGDLEEQNILDMDNDVDLYCLHERFTDHIDSSLNDFIGSWNSHPLTSENNQTSSQLFYTGNNHESSDSDSDRINITAYNSNAKGIHTCWS